LPQPTAKKDAILKIELDEVKKQHTSAKVNFTRQMQSLSQVQVDQMLADLKK
jgi:hypothetical protein